MANLNDPPIAPPTGDEDSVYRSLVREWRTGLVGYLRNELLNISTSVYLSTNQSIALNTDTKVDFDTEIRDNGSNYSTSSNRYTVGGEEVGRYRVSGVVTFSHATAADVFVVSIFVNGTEHTTTIMEAPTREWVAVPFNRVIELSDGDYVEIFAKNKISADTIESGSKVSYFEIERIGS